MLSNYFLDFPRYSDIISLKKERSCKNFNLINLSRWAGLTNKKLEKGLLNVLQGLKETRRNMEQKQDLKTWSDISVPISIKDALARLTNDELSEIRKRLDLKGVSHLKKGELVELLSMKIPALLEKICMNIDLDRYNLVKEIIRNGGSFAAPKLEVHQLDYLRTSGFIFTGTFEGKKILVMPEEILKNPLIQKNDKEIRSICRRNSEWIKLTQGLLYYYGTLDIKELAGLLEKYTNQPVNYSDYFPVIVDASSYYTQIRMDHIGFSYVRVFDPERVKREHQMRKNLEFFPFSKEQLLKTGEPGYVERNDSYLQFVDFLTKNYEISRKDADGIVEECVYATNIGEAPNDILQFLSSRLEFENLDVVRACMDKAVKLMNNTRQWFLKGFTPKELSAEERKSLRPLPDRKTNIVEFNTKKKIGRNDPCPCGSGKKYKLCCGRR